MKIDRANRVTLDAESNPRYLYPLLAKDAPMHAGLEEIPMVTFILSTFTDSNGIACSAA
jgi:hypothetical protein